jgi:hypothetical protein
MYRYEDMKNALRSDDGLDMYVKIRDHVRKLLAEAGACTMWAAIRGVTGDSRMMLACVDRMVEVGELTEIVRPGVAAQDRVFVKKGTW